MRPISVRTHSVSELSDSQIKEGESCELNPFYPPIHEYAAVGKSLFQQRYSRKSDMLLPTNLDDQIFWGEKKILREANSINFEKG